MKSKSLKSRLPKPDDARTLMKEFKEFAMRGNVIDMAVGIVVGTAFTKLVSSLVDNLVMPPLGLLMGKMDLSNYFIALDGQDYATLSEAEEYGAPVLKYGMVINQVIDFIILAFVIFLVIRQINRIRRRMEAQRAKPQEPTTKACDYCFSTVSIKATRCPHCTSHLVTTDGHKSTTATD